MSKINSLIGQIDQVITNMQALANYGEGVDGPVIAMATKAADDLMVVLDAMTGEQAASPMHRVLFMFSTGIEGEMLVPAGTLAKFKARCEAIQSAFSLASLDKKDFHNTPQAPIPDELWCETVRQHNRFVKYFYADLGDWAQKPPTGETETLRPEDVAPLWHFLRLLRVPAQNWTGGHYHTVAQEIFDLLTTGETDEMEWNQPVLTPHQASGIIHLFAATFGLLDMPDLVVPIGRDYLTEAEDLLWCETCCAHSEFEDLFECTKEDCPLRAEYDQEDEDE